MSAPTRKPGRPATGQMPIQRFRAPADHWAAGLTSAAAEGHTLSDVLREFLAWYTRQPGATAPTRPAAR